MMALPIREPPQRRRSFGPVSPKRIYRNLSVRLRGGTSSDHLQAAAVVKAERGWHRKSVPSSPQYLSVWEAIENDDIEAIHLMLGKASVQEELNRLTSEGLVPLDMAALMNNTPLAKMLTRAGARDNPNFSHAAEREAHLCSLISEAGHRVQQLQDAVNETPEKRRELRIWTLRQKMYCQMQENFQQMDAPSTPCNVTVLVTSATGLTVYFQEPCKPKCGIITRYKVEWSCSANFDPLCGSETIQKLKCTQYTITGLTSGVKYFVRVSAYNVKGWGPAQISSPPSAIPSSWKECSGIKVRGKEQAESMGKLLEQVKDPLYRGYFIETSKVHTPSKRLSVSRSLKYLFQSASKFVRNLQRGVYLAAIFYQKDKILVTQEEQIPLVEIDSCSTSVIQEFHWFAKLSCAWKDIQWLQQGMTSALSLSSSILQTRQKILLAVSQLQSSLGTEDLGQVYYEPIKDQQGNVLLVTLQEHSIPQALETLHWTSISSFQRDKKKSCLSAESTAVDVLISALKEKLAYHRYSSQISPPGLYLGFLKLCSSVDQIKVLVPQKLPNLLCHMRIRENKHISREEWDWLQNLSTRSDVTDLKKDLDFSHNLFLKELRAAITHLLMRLDIPLTKARNYRLYTQEVLEFGDKVSFLLLLPPSEDICSAPGQDGHLSGFLTLPLQMFEIVHFSTYEYQFFSKYCQASVLLELDSQLSQQALREALDTQEVTEAKERHDQVMGLIQRVDDLWREVRWITDALHYVRYKQNCSDTRLLWIMEQTITKDSDENLDFYLHHAPSLPSCSDCSDRIDSIRDSQSSLDKDDVFWLTDGNSVSASPSSPEEANYPFYQEEESSPSSRGRKVLKSRVSDVDMSKTKLLQNRFHSLPRTKKEWHSEKYRESLTTEMPRATRLPERSLVEWINAPQET
ncbi:ankyrin repeat and fibronectin type-III domain-containing protein 1-like [Erpetoichthys calabaricus]|uniref:Ankyrin repeat and fibronectin type-III domain-containing protein 1-like n=1 Tax=Erpetoichthys calabaricus TaxID=27687 RepID=A0A8C4T8T6_ERPCA|nr:ankyrin repeat and fibronectin type-III domain-containing protein 1-like [Erpetoichthys calabaricus]XP_051790801.1 ankyrin repeat and fibronectin type-III domain-containing protein 1-like [Erpetoichthys calabaricus]